MVSTDQSSTADTSSEDTLQMSPEKESETEKRETGRRKDDGTAQGCRQSRLFAKKEGGA